MLALPLLALLDPLDGPLLGRQDALIPDVNQLGPFYALQSLLLFNFLLLLLLGEGVMGKNISERDIIIRKQLGHDKQRVSLVFIRSSVNDFELRDL